MPPETAETRWRVVATLLAAGVISAFQVGKAAVALPLLRVDLGLDLATAAWVVGAYGTIGAVAGLAAGAAFSMVETRRALIGGLAAIAAGSVSGAFAGSGAALIATRVIEGFGFLAVVITVPTLLRMASHARDRDVVFTLWSANMPAGTAVMMLVGPSLADWGWRGVWLVNGALAVLLVLVVRLFVPENGKSEPADFAALPRRVRSILAMPGPALLATAFGLYTFHYFALTGLMPTLLVERLGLTVTQAGSLTAAIVIANALGNISAGLLLRRGIPLWAIAASAFGFAGLAAFGIFSNALPIAMIATLAAASLAVTGMVPASIYAASSRLTSSASALGMTLGLIAQGSNIGQLLGPVVLGTWVERLGWASAPILVAALAVAEIAIALRLRLLMRRPAVEEGREKP
jgi:DHA1 family inner membrane transport protein